MKKNISLTALFLLPYLLFPLPLMAGQTCKDTIISNTPDDKFIIREDGTVIDNTTGLMWMRCSFGKTWDGKTCKGDSMVLSWDEALKTAAGYQYAGHDDWRLPNKNELESIIEEKCFGPAVNVNIFPGTPPIYFWSSSPYAATLQGAWSVDFAYGNVNASVKSGKIPIRLVRDTE